MDGNARIRKSYVKSCKYCNKQFNARKIDTIFCSTRCSDQHSIEKHRKPVFIPEIRNCKVCKKEFIAKRYNAVSCSSSCNANNYRKKHGRSRVLKKPKFSEISLCIICNKEFTKKTKEQNCCSRSCWFKQRRRENQVLVKKVCPNCNIEIITSNNTKVFCSSKCRETYYERIARASLRYKIKSSLITSNPDFLKSVILTDKLRLEIKKKFPHIINLT